MIVRETTKAISDTTNPRDVAGARAVKEMLESAGENVTLKPTTKVNVGGTLKNLNTYINQIAETTANVAINEKFAVEDISENITLTSTLNEVTLVYAYKVNNLLFIQFKCDADDDVTVSGGDDWGRATISGLSLKSDRLTTMCEYTLETDLASIAYLTDTTIVFHALPFAVGDDGAQAYATFVALLND